jgi:two-component system response regulator TtrR
MNIPGRGKTSVKDQMVATVYVVDDDESIRELLTWLMKRNNIPVEAFADAAGFLQVYQPDAPGCLVLDLNLPGMSGLDLQAYLNEQGVVMPVIFLSGGADVPKAVRAVKGGAIDFIEKPFDYKQILELVCDCLARDTAAREARARGRSQSERLALLSQREKEVLELIVAGKLNREIADELVISIKTVEVHRAHIMEKLGVRSVAQLVQIVMVG